MLYGRPVEVFFASDGGAFTSGGGRFGISTSSTSNTSIPFGSRAPLYASDSGIHRRRFSPGTMSYSPSLKQAMTRFTGKMPGLPLVTELSNIEPSVFQPV